MSSLGGVARGSRSRFLAIAVILMVLGSAFYLIHSTYNQLQVATHSNDRCQQAKDTLSAQLQVAFEQNNRMEATLKQERISHKKAHEELEKKKNEMQKNLEKEKQALQSKLKQAEKDNQLLENQLSDNQDSLRQAEERYATKLEEVQAQKDAEIEKLQGQLRDLLTQKDHLEMELNEEKRKSRGIAGEMELCRHQYHELQKEILSLKEQNKVLKKAPSEIINNEIGPLPEKGSKKDITFNEAKLKDKKTPQVLKKPKTSTAQLKPLAPPAAKPSQESAMAAPDPAEMQEAQKVNNPLLPAESVPIHNEGAAAKLGQQLPAPHDLRRPHQRVGLKDNNLDHHREADVDYDNGPEGDDDQEGDDNPRPRGGLGNRAFQDFEDQENNDDLRVPQQNNGHGEGVVVAPR